MVVAFRPRSAMVRRDGPVGGETGRILLFTGVRYERHGEPSHPRAGKGSACVSRRRPMLRPQG